MFAAAKRMFVAGTEALVKAAKEKKVADLEKELADSLERVGLEMTEEAAGELQEQIDMLEMRLEEARAALAALDETKKKYEDSEDEDDYDYDCEGDYDDCEEKPAITAPLFSGQPELMRNLSVEDSGALDSGGTEWHERLLRLKRIILSTAVQVQLPKEVEEVPCKLSSDEVKSVFINCVPRVDKYLYRGQAGQYSLPFMVSTYEHGLSTFVGTPVHQHLLWLYRSVVHYAHERHPGCERYLRQVAEAFLDCQAVQGRVIERIGLEIVGVAPDFRGLMARLIGEYKIIAVKMVAASQGKDDDKDPAHYENRLTADLGDSLGLNADDIRRARLDNHANERYPTLAPREMLQLKRLCRRMFDLEAVLQAFSSEVNSFGPETPPESLARNFFAWVQENMAEKHIIFDEETFTKIDIEKPLALAIFEIVLLGQLHAAREETYRGVSIHEVFGGTAASDESAPTKAVDQALLFSEYVRKPSVSTWLIQFPQRRLRHGDC